MNWSKVRQLPTDKRINILEAYIRSQYAINSLQLGGENNPFICTKIEIKIKDRWFQIFNSH